MAPALNEPLNQTQLPPQQPESAESTESSFASSSPRPGILPTGNGNGAAAAAASASSQSAVVHQQQQQPQHIITNRYQQPKQQQLANAPAKNSFQLAFIQQIQQQQQQQQHQQQADSASSNTATNGPAATGPSSVQRHMDHRNQSPASSRSAAAAAAAAAVAKQTASPTFIAPPAIAAAAGTSSSRSSSSTATTNALTIPTSSIPYQSAATLSLEQQLADLQQQEDGTDDGVGGGGDQHDADDAALKCDVQELADLGLHLEEALDEALTESLCNTSPTGGIIGQHHHHHHHHNLQLSATSGSSAQQPNNLAKDAAAGGGESVDIIQEIMGMGPGAEIDLMQMFKSISSDDLSLFDNVDVMDDGMVGLGDVHASPPLLLKELDTADVRLEIKKRQTQMERKCDFLLRRLRKLQTREMAAHVDEEVLAVVASAQRLQATGGAGAEATGAAGGRLADERETAAFLQRLEAAADEQQQLLPTTAAAAATVAGQQRRAAARDASAAVGGGVLAVPNLPATGGVSRPRLVPCFDREYSGQLALTAGHLQTELKLVAAALDSDATASSSGGDSGDEGAAMQYGSGSGNSRAQQQHLAAAANAGAASSSGREARPSVSNEKWTFNGVRMVRKYKTKKIKRQELQRAKRAALRWARERATIASRWSWLLAQVSDLEYRIRQHSELHQQIKKNKGAVQFEDGGPNVAPSSQQLAATVNGYRGLLPGNNVVTAHKAGDDVQAAAAAAADATVAAGGTEGIGGSGSGLPKAAAAASAGSPGSCRTRAFQRNEFRKRKLLQTTNLHTISKKAAKTSTVKCGCQWPLYPCALCTGRPDPTAPRDLPDMLSASERVGLLDAGFHPVISFSSDIGQGIHIESALRNTDFQTKACRANSKSLMRSSLALQKKKAAAGGDHSSGQPSSAGKKKEKNALANKLKKKSKKNNHLNNSSSESPMSGSASSTPAHNRSSQSMALGGGSMTASQQHQSENFEYGPNGAMLPRSKNPSPAPGRGGSQRVYASTSATSGLNDRRSRGGGGGAGAYDIDNIVIPHSVAATTRVEIMQYAEIQTPKWRTLDVANPHNSSANQSTDHHHHGLLKVEPLSTTLPSAVGNSSASPVLAASNAAAAATAAVQRAAATNAAPPAKDDMLEDISQDAILRRHENCLLEERMKFSTFLKYPWCTRSRANQRIDSRADSSGANTPDPTSPALPRPPGAAAGGDAEAVVLPVGATNPQHLPSIAELRELQYASNGGRRRTVSTKRWDTREDRTIDQRDYVQPYEQREFPLSDDAFASMLQQMPAAHHDIIDRVIEQHQQQQRAAAAAGGSHTTRRSANRNNRSSLSATTTPTTPATAGHQQFELVLSGSGHLVRMRPISGFVDDTLRYAELATLWRDDDEETASALSADDVAVMDDHDDVAEEDEEDDDDEEVNDGDDPNDPEWCEPDAES